ncbi:MAG: hypothetical protein WC455_30155 [Dehalococcoidia bacterium]
MAYDYRRAILLVQVLALKSELDCELGLRTLARSWGTITYFQDGKFDAAETICALAEAALEHGRGETAKCLT